ncbi:MAG TPA: hypothetical protein GX521_09835 [Firmicutes bacterium]|nr:hypothetical protein [Bacillota bacterium]
MDRTKRQMLIGGTLLITGWLTVFGIVLELIPTSIWLNMVAYAVTLVGFTIGIMGVAANIAMNLKKHRQDGE